MDSDHPPINWRKVRIHFGKDGKGFKGVAIEDVPVKFLQWYQEDWLKKKYELQDHGVNLSEDDMTLMRALEERARELTARKACKDPSELVAMMGGIA